MNFKNRSYKILMHSESVWGHIEQHDATIY